MARGASREAIFLQRVTNARLVPRVLPRGGAPDKKNDAPTESTSILPAHRIRIAYTHRTRLAPREESERLSTLMLSAAGLRF